MFSWGARTAAFLGAILTVFAGVVVSRSLKSSVREKKKSAAKLVKGGLAGCGPAELESAHRKLAKSHVAGFCSLFLCLAAGF